MVTSEKEPVYDVSGSTSSYADLIKKILDEYSSASSLKMWFLGSACIIAIFLFIQNFSKESVYLPFFAQGTKGGLIMTLEASRSAFLRPYNFFGDNSITFNDILKLFILLYIVLMFLITFWNLVKKFVKYLTIIFPLFNKPISWIVNKIPRKYTQKKWLAEPIALSRRDDQGQQIYPALRRKIPIEIRNFQYIRFDIHILGNFPHWRAGIFITCFETDHDYVFHLLKDSDDSRILARMTKREFVSGRHVNQLDKELAGLDLSNINFEVKKVAEDTYSLNINSEEVDRYVVPHDDFKFVEIGAWADDKPYKVEFENIKLEG